MMRYSETSFRNICGIALAAGALAMSVTATLVIIGGVELPRLFAAGIVLLCAGAVGLASVLRD